ncbi:MAG: helix-turn-helix domain-containing protein [Puniceicoccaceae bacterium]|nr:helix-turn-helix domain-containing protein [Puniceicoccaceae bacterium]
MSHEIIKQARDGIEAKSYSITDLAREAGIPQATLSDMLQEGWGKRVFQACERLERLKDGMRVIDRQNERAGG